MLVTVRQNKEPRLRIVCLVVVFHALACTMLGQDKSWFGVTGAVSLSGDVYEMQADDNSIQARRPPELWRLSIEPVFHLGDIVRIPISIILNSRETNVLTPSLKAPNVRQFVANPLQRLSIAPDFGWLKMELGSQRPSYSRFTIGDVQMFGVGAKLDLGESTIMGTIGIQQRGVIPDFQAMAGGSFESVIYAARLVHNSSKVSHVGITAARIIDDTTTFRRVTRPDTITVAITDTLGVRIGDTSVVVESRPTTLPVPREAVNLSIDFKAGVANVVMLSGEIAGMIISRDLYASMFREQIPVASIVIPTRISSYYDFAGFLKADFGDDFHGVALSGEYVGPGYIAAGYPFFQPDHADVMVSPRLRLFDSYFMFDASAGYRLNNIAQNVGATSTNFIGRAAATVKILEETSISATFSNYGLRTSTTNDTLRVESVGVSYSMSPLTSISLPHGVHTIVATLSHDSFKDISPWQLTPADNVTRLYMISWSLGLSQIPLSTSVVFSIMNNDLSLAAMTIINRTLTVGYRFADVSITPSISVGYNSIGIDQQPADTQMSVRGSIRWQATKKLTLSVSASVNDFQVSAAGRGGYRETLFQTVLRYSI